MLFSNPSKSGAFLALCLVGVLSTPLSATEVHIQDFEASDGGLLAGGVLPSWQYGVPVNGPLAAQSGTKCWATSLAGNYNNGEDSYLTSGTINLSAAGGGPLIFSWWQYLDSEAGLDSASLEISNDGGLNWKRVYGEVSGPEALAWTREFVQLDDSSAVSNFRYRFRMQSDGSSSAAGFYVDTVRIASLSRTQVYLEDFESGDGDYVASGSPSTWEYGTPIAGPGTAYSGLNAWGTSLNAYYASNEDSSLVSPAIDLSAHLGKALVLSWHQHLVTESIQDLARVEVRADATAPWMLVYGPASGPASDSWMRKSVFLGPEMATPGFQIRFTLVADPFFENSGFYVDDVEVSSISGNTVPSVTWSDPAAIVSGTPLGATQLNANSSVPGTFSYTPASGTVLPTGDNQELTATFTPNDLLTYSPVITTVMIDVTGVSYGSWMPFPPGTPLAETLPDADYDHDGRNNLIEYGFVTDATLGTDPDAPRYVVVDDGGTDYPGIEFSLRSDDSALHYGFESSAALRNWQTKVLTFGGSTWDLAVGGPVLHSQVETSPGIWRLKIRAEQPLSDSAKIFMRVSVSQ